MKKLGDVFHTLWRKLILKSMTDFAGKIEIKEDRVLCHVNKRTLNYTFNAKDYYNICLCGFDSVKMDLRTQEFFKDKPVYYVFENITFDKGVRVETFFDVNVIFKNCTFNGYVELAGVNNVIFENNKYLDNDNSYEDRKTFLSGYGKKIKFVNDNLVNARENSDVSKLGMNINFNSVELVDFDTDVESSIDIKAKELVMDNAVIECSSMNLDCDDIIYKRSSVIDVKKKIIINNKNSNFDIDSACAPIMIYNGKVVKEKEKVNKEVVSGRQRLISQLKVISNLFSNINEETLKKAEEKINRRSIGKIKKK